jgi:hypothetical protein
MVLYCAYLLCAVLDPVPYMMLLGSRYASNMLREPVVQLVRRVFCEAECERLRHRLMKEKSSLSCGGREI